MCVVMGTRHYSEGQVCGEAGSAPPLQGVVTYDSGESFSLRLCASVRKNYGQADGSQAFSPSSRK